MRQLQHNFTTPEQSRRLLELGLPADSADCRMYNYHGKLQISVHKNGRNNQTLKWDKAIPCWSVGRLIEIYVLCTGEEPIALHWMGDYLESFVKMFEIRVGTKELDFSKLA